MKNIKLMQEFNMVSAVWYFSRQVFCVSGINYYN